jgi:hypothetical protein
MARKALTPADKIHIDRIASQPDTDMAAVKRFFDSYRGGHAQLVADVRGSIRQGLDEVIDGRRTRRHSYAQMSSPEKSFCGIRIESALVRRLELPLGVRLDVSLAGVDVDIKASNKRGWMIGPGQVGCILLLIEYNEIKRQFSIGLVRAHAAFLNPSKNRDAKRTITHYAKRHIVWLAQNETLPISILSSLSTAQVNHILSGSSRAERLKRFLGVIPAFTLFSRTVVETIVGGDDPMRGTRHDRAVARLAKHPLGDTRILSYQRNKIVEALGYPKLASNEFMKVSVTDLQKKGFTL